ncbi:hypothetical protein BLNAU_11123 [Blattamonas nauphoetae]|uniref:Uncharacterized protein n=1 Tax=Blattamonas nauphoetae TaxID=2049346 RepID=A0ABQ9XN87_9EUKA|nr:hypothetical protein BLNAU_11123 [Blattamonas nauphoetae]
MSEVMLTIELYTASTVDPAYMITISQTSMLDLFFRTRKRAKRPPKNAPRTPVIALISPKSRGRRPDVANWTVLPEAEKRMSAEVVDVVTGTSIPIDISTGDVTIPPPTPSSPARTPPNMQKRG